MADSRTHIYANDARSTLASGITADTTLILIADHFSDFPLNDTDQIFKVTLEDPTTGIREICNCTGRNDGELEVERGQEGTTALDWPVGTVVAHRNTAETMEHLEEAAAAGGGGGGGDEVIARFGVEPTGSPNGAPSAGLANITWDCGQPGFYAIDFVADYFADTPIAVATAGVPGVIATIEGLSQSSMSVQLTTHEGNPVDALFFVIAIGNAGTPTPPGLNLSTVYIEAHGGEGSGAQEPRASFMLGNGNQVPLGLVWAGGGGNGYSFYVDYVDFGGGTSLTEGDDPRGAENFGIYLEEVSSPFTQWWRGDTTGLDASNYEARLTHSTGSPPTTGSIVGEWLNMGDSTELSWGYGTVFEAPGLAGEWILEIRPVGSEEAEVTAFYNVRQVID